MVKENKILKVINLGDNAFNNANVPTCIFILQHLKQDEYEFPYYDSRELSIEETNFEKVSYLIKKTNVLKNSNDLTIGINKADSNIIEKINSKSTTINLISSEVASGISTGADDVFKLTCQQANNLSLEDDLLRKAAAGRNVNAYEPIMSDDVLIYSTKNSNTPSFANIYNYLLPYEERLSKKRETQKGLIPWWSLHWPRTEELFKGKKIVLRQTSDKIVATIDTNDIFTLNSTLIIRLLNEEDYESVLGVLNSNIGQFIYKSVSQEEGRAFAEVKPQNVRKLYIPTDSTIKETISNLVNEILSDISLKEEKTKAINEALYKYYELTDEEIQLIEKETNY